MDGGPLREPDVDRVRARLPDGGAIAATREGKILGVRVDVLADHGAFNATAQPTKYPAGFFHVFTGSYDLEAAHCHVRGVYTNKAPGGVAYACSFRVTEAVYLVERMVDCLARELRMDPAELRSREPDPRRAVPVSVARRVGCTTRAITSGTAQGAMRSPATTSCGASRRPRRERGELMGIGVGFFTEAVGAGPRKHMDILGLGMNDGAALRVHPTGKAQLGISVQTQGQGHETTFAQIVAEELGIPPEDIDVIHGDTDTTPYGLGTYGSRSTPVSGAATALVARKVRDRRGSSPPRCSRSRPRTSSGKRAAARWFVKGDPEQGATIQEIAMAARGSVELPEGVESRTRRRDRVRPTEPDVPVRRLRMRGRHRPGRRQR